MSSPSFRGISQLFNDTMPVEKDLKIKEKLVPKKNAIKCIIAETGGHNQKKKNNRRKIFKPDKFYFFLSR